MHSALSSLHLWIRVSPQPDANGQYPYKNVMHCGAKILKEEGLFAFWRGFFTYYGRTAREYLVALVLPSSPVSHRSCSQPMP